MSPEIREWFTSSEIKGGKCTFDREVTLAQSKDGKPSRFCKRLLV